MNDEPEDMGGYVYFKVLWQYLSTGLHKYN